MEEKTENGSKRRKLGFWKWAMASVAFRLILCYFSQNLKLSARPEVATPLTSLRRLAEGYWLKQLSMSPYSGSMYHGSPLLLSILGPLTTKKIEGQPDHLLCRPTVTMVMMNADDPIQKSKIGPATEKFVSHHQVASPDVVSAILIRSTGCSLETAHGNKLKLLGLGKLFDGIEILPSGDISALVYLWNPFTILSCIGFNTAPIENLFVILSLYGASAGLAPLAAFGWVISSHLSFYPLVLVIPVIFLLGYGLDAPPRNLFRRSNFQVGEERIGHDEEKPAKPTETKNFSWRQVIFFFIWASIWISYLWTLCAISMKEYGGVGEMFKRTYGFILTIEDLSPNIGVLWYFFAEVFDFFRNFFLIVFHMNIVFMILPLAIRLNHRPCFLAFVYLAISSMLKSYPSVGDSALYLSLLALFLNELAEMQFSFFLFCGYIGVSLLSPVMHNLWIWRGTGNANFYFATAMAYACFQIVLVVESVNAMLNYDRKIKKLCTNSKE